LGTSSSALKVGLKVDADVLPPGILDKVDLKSPVTTVALDGSAATLADVVSHYDRVRKRGLTADQQRDLIEYLKSR